MKTVKICSPIVNKIISGEYVYDYQYEFDQIKEKQAVVQDRCKKEKENLRTVMGSLSEADQRRLQLAGEKGASSWLLVLPIREFGFALHKRHFVDALCLRYGWLTGDLPVHCACGEKFSAEHALSCLKGGFVVGRHNEIRDFTASILTEVCNDVSIEPTLQPVPEKDSFPSSANVTDGARMDIAVNGFWGDRYEKCYLDVRIFNPHATSNRSSDINKIYSNHEREKKRLYERQLVEIEHSSFNPLIFLVTGGMANGCSLFYNHIPKHWSG